MNADVPTTAAPTLSPKTRPTTSTAFRQAKNLQQLAYDTAFDKNTTASARAQLLRAWSELEERKRILRMRPKPRDIDVDPRNHRPSRRAVQAQILNALEPEAPVLDVEVEPVPEKPASQSVLSSHTNASDSAKKVEKSELDRPKTNPPL